MEKEWVDVARIQAVRIVMLEGILAGLRLLDWVVSGHTGDLLLALGWLALVVFDVLKYPHRA